MRRQAAIIIHQISQTTTRTTTTKTTGNFSGSYLPNCQISLQQAANWDEGAVVVVGGLGGGAPKAKHCRLIIPPVTCLPFSKGT